MKKSFLALASFAAIAVGCQVEPMAELPVEESVVFEAVTEAYDPATKTTMSGLDVVWSAGDKLGVFTGYMGYTDAYELTEGQGTQNAKFAFLEESLWSGSEFEMPVGNAAFYPYNEELMVQDLYDDVVRFIAVLPETQTYTEGTFANGSFPMIAQTESKDDHSFEFKNVLGVLKLQLVGTKTVKSVTVAGNNGEILAGSYMVGMVDGVPVGQVGDYPTYSTVTVNSEDGIVLDETEATDFYVALIPTVFENGLTVTIKDSEGIAYQVKASTSVEIKRSRILEMPVIDADQLVSPVDFSANASLTDAEISVRLNDAEAIGFYGISALKENYTMWASYFTDPMYFDMLVTGGLTDMQLTGRYYEGTTVTESITTFGWSDESLGYGMQHSPMPGNTYTVIIVPVYEDKDEYTTLDGFSYEVSTNQLTTGGDVDCPDYTVDAKYFTVDVTFQPSDDVTAAVYRFFKEGETLPGPEDYLDELVMTPVIEDDGTYTVSNRISWGELPGTAFKLCIAFADADGKTQMYVLDLETEEIPYSEETLEIVIDEADYDGDDDVVYATLASWPEDCTIYYSIDTNALDPEDEDTAYNEAELISDVLLNPSTSIYQEATVVGGNITVELSVAPQTYKQADRYVHFFAVTAGGEVSHIVTSDAVKIPVLPTVE